MSNHDADAQAPKAPADDPLDLNKETLGDLDVEATDVKGGAAPSTIQCLFPSKTLAAGINDVAR